MNSSVSKKDERLFCRFYRLRRNHREAAALCGYRDPEKTGLKLLYSKRLRRELAGGDNAVTSAEVADGLRRIAFGGVSDAVRLLYSDGLPEDIDSMDLFCVAELKRPKGGGMEIKFFDRIKALEQLKDISRGLSDGSVEPFYRALELSAKGLFTDGGGEDSGV